MEESSAKGLKQERRKRRRVAQIKMTLICIIGIWLVVSMVICGVLLYKVHVLEEDLKFLLKNFTVSQQIGQIEEDANQTGADTGESAYLNLEAASWAGDTEESYGIAQAVNQEENLAQEGDAHKVYLTFDDGPSMDVTPEILDILKKNDVKATFFILNYGEKSIPILERIAREGHTIGIHGFSHDYAEIYTSEDAFMENVQKLHDKLLADVGYDARIVRFPGGSSNTISEKYKKGIMTKLTKRLEKEGWKYLDWNVSTGDAEGSNIPSSQLVETVKRELKPDRATVVLLHDTSAKQSSVDALQDIIDFGIENGYTFCPVAEDMTMVHHRVNN